MNDDRINLLGIAVDGLTALAEAMEFDGYPNAAQAIRQHAAELVEMVPSEYRITERS